MRQRLFTFLFAFFAVNAMMNAETVQLSFSGVTTEGRYCLLDSVKIENLTQNWSYTLDCSIDTTYDLPVAQVPTGIDNVAMSEDDGGLLSVSQNFAVGNTVVSINPIDNGIVRMRVMDMVGRVIIEHAEYLTAGQHHYILQLSTPQTYMISVVTDSEHASAKILNMSSNGRYELSRISSLPLTNQVQSRRKLRAEGEDLMRYTGYTNQKGAAVSSEQITQYQSSPEHIVLRFAPVAKSQEGMYVGMMGFNSDIYPFPFDVLTSSNLSIYQNFVSNLTMANGTILYHAVYTSLGNIINAPVPEKLENVSIVTFTDGLDIGSWRKNSNYPSEALYLAAVNKQIHRTCIDGVKLDAYAIGVRGSDVTDVARFESDLYQLASDSDNVYNVLNMAEVNARFREIAAKIYNTKVNYSMTIKLPAPDPGSIIRFTFDDVTNASNSIYYIEGTYDYDFSANMGILKDVVYSGVQCSDGTLWTSVPDDIFDVFTIHDLTSNLGERISTSSMRQWSYIPSTNNWQINSEFDPSYNSSSTEERTSALVMLVLDCSSSMDSDFGQMKYAANNFLSILTGSGSLYKPDISEANYTLGDLQVTLNASIYNTYDLSIVDKGFCISEFPNMDDAVFYSCGVGTENFEYHINGLVEGKTYYVRSYADNYVGRTYGDQISFTAVAVTLPEVSLSTIWIVDADKVACMGKIEFDGYDQIIERGFCWGENPNPTISDNMISVDSDNNTFQDTIKNLQERKTYYVRAFARNKKGIVYSDTSLSTCFSAIHYTATEQLSTAYHGPGVDYNAFDVPRRAHVFKDGKGAIVFEGIVTRIGNNAFYGCNTLTSIAIPETVTIIGHAAFSSCSNLTSIVIPNTVDSIGGCAFENCTNLKSVHINDITAWCRIDFAENKNAISSDHYNSNPLYYADSLYCNGILLEDLQIPESIDSIRRNAFIKYRALKSVSMPNNVVKICNYAFYGCSNLKSVTFSNSITSIGILAFYQCTALTSVTIPNSVIEIGSSAFNKCTGMTSVEIPNSVTVIGDNAFKYCDNLTRVSINNDSIVSKTYTAKTGMCMLFGEQVNEYIIGDSVKSIGDYCFYGCTNLQSITFGRNIKTMGQYAFEHCDNFKSVKINDIASWCQINYESYKRNPLYYAHKLYLGDELITDLIIPENVTNIKESAFYGCTSISSTIIGSKVANIEENAFCGCSNLKTIEINSDSIANGTYSFEFSLIKVFGNQVNKFIFGDSVTGIGDYAFYKFKNLTFIEFPNGLTRIGLYAFSQCSNLSSINIPINIESIGDYGFYNCSMVASITCNPATPPACGTYAFANVTTSIPVYVPSTSVSSYTNASVWSNFTNIQAISE